MRDGNDEDPLRDNREDDRVREALDEGATASRVGGMHRVGTWRSLNSTERRLEPAQERATQPCLVPRDRVLDLLKASG